MGHYTIRTNDDEDQAIKKAQEATGQASASKTFMTAILELGVSLDIENYCTLRLLFNQMSLVYREPECDKPGKYCSLSRLPFRGC